MFFSVKTPVKIMGKVYTPCVCYPLSDFLVPTIEKMVEEGQAYKFENKVYFQNGKVLEKKPATEEKVAVEKTTKKNKKAKELPLEETEEAVVPSPEEIADNPDDIEGF